MNEHCVLKKHILFYLSFVFWHLPAKIFKCFTKRGIAFKVLQILFFILLSFLYFMNYCLGDCLVIYLQLVSGFIYHTYKRSARQCCDLLKYLLSSVITNDRSHFFPAIHHSIIVKQPTENHLTTNILPSMMSSTQQLDLVRISWMIYSVKPQIVQYRLQATELSISIWNTKNPYG